MSAGQEKRSSPWWNTAVIGWEYVLPDFYASLTSHWPTTTITTETFFWFKKTQCNRSDTKGANLGRCCVYMSLCACVCVCTRMYVCEGQGLMSNVFLNYFLPYLFHLRQDLWLNLTLTDVGSLAIEQALGIILSFAFQGLGWQSHATIPGFLTWVPEFGTQVPMFSQLCIRRYCSKKEGGSRKEGKHHWVLGAVGQCFNVVYKAVLKCGLETEDFRSQETTEKNETRAARAHTEWRGQSNGAREMAQQFEHWLLLQRSRVWLPKPTWQLTTLCDSSYRGSNALGNKHLCGAYIYNRDSLTK